MPKIGEITMPYSTLVESNSTLLHVNSSDVNWLTLALVLFAISIGFKLIEKALDVLFKNNKKEK